MAVNVGNIVVSYSTLYKSKEVNFLFTKPVPYPKIFVIKFLDNFFYSSTTLLLIICSVIAGYGTFFKMNIWFYPVSVLFIILPFMLTAASLGVIFLMLILKISSKIGIRKILFLLFAFYILSLILFFRISDPVKIVSSVMAYYPNTGGYFGFLDSPVLKFLPNYWAADAFYWISSGQFIKALPDILLQLSSAVFLFSLAYFLSVKLYYQTWLDSLKLSFKRNNITKRNNSLISFSGNSAFKPQTEALLKKEFLQFFREPGQWIHLSVMLLLILIFIFSLTGIDPNLLSKFNSMLKTIIYLVIFLFNIFLISSLALRFVFPVISIEGEAYWKIKSSPVNLKKLISIKFLSYFLIIFLIGLILNIFSQLSFPAKLLQTSTINIVFICLTIVSLNFGMGSFFADFKEKNPIRIASSQGATITFLLTLIYLVFLVVVLFIPVYDFFNMEKTGLKNAVFYLNITNIIIAAVSIIITIIFLGVGRKALRRDL
jgi:ABC-2 type transport system permease protein